MFLSFPSRSRQAAPNQQRQQQQQSHNGGPTLHWRPRVTLSVVYTHDDHLYPLEAGAAPRIYDALVHANDGSVVNLPKRYNVFEVQVDDGNAKRVADAPTGGTPTCVMLLCREPCTGWWWGALGE